MKRKFTVFLALCMLALSLLVAGCGSSESEKFVGTWQGQITKGLSGEYHHFMTIEKLSDTEFQVTTYAIIDGSKAPIKLKNNSDKKVYSYTLKKDDPKVLYKNDGEKLILTNDSKITNTEKEMDFTKKADKVLPFNEFNPLPGTPEPK